jgi:hypothetical protein
VRFVFLLRTIDLSTNAGKALRDRLSTLPEITAANSGESLPAP